MCIIKINPFKVKKILAASGSEKRTWNSLSKAIPRTPTGIVANKINQIILDSGFSIERNFKLAKNARINCSHLFQKISNSVIALAACKAMIINKYGDSPAVVFVRNDFHSPPIHAGTSIEWPKLEIGNNSVIPCKNPVNIACQYESSSCPATCVTISANN